MIKGGYFNNIVRLNLDNYSVENESIDLNCFNLYLGGNGFGTKILWDEVNKDEDPLSPKNKLIVSTGPFNGTTWPCSGRIEFIAKSPLTGIYGDSNAAGYFGAELKQAGIDAIILEGRADRPVYIFIDNGEIIFKNAKHLWGKETTITEEVIKAELNDNNLKVACIGPAAENLVRFALINCTKSRHAARSGMGTVMASKNIKAIAVRGNKKIPVYDKDSFNNEAKKAVKAMKSHEFTKSLTMLGTAGIVTLMSEIGRLPTKNHQQGHFEHAMQIGGESLEKYITKKIACYRCPISCDKVVQVQNNGSSVFSLSSVEYETLCSLGSQLYISNLEAVLKANKLCDELGIDTISTGGCIAFLMELYQRNLLSANDLDGLDLTWGNYEAVYVLIKKIAYREGVGDLIADGVRVAAQRIGGDAYKYAMEVKGQEIPCQDGRAQQSMGLAHVTASRGADHLKGFPTLDEVGHPEEAKKRYGENYLPEIVDGTSHKYKAMLVKDGEDFCAVIDSLGICKFGTLFPPAVYWDTLARGLTALTGVDNNEAVLRKTGERIYNLQRCYNIKRGISREDDRLPKRFLEEKSPSGRAKGKVVNLEYMLNEYYTMRGWDLENGYPLKDKLNELGLEGITL